MSLFWIHLQVLFFACKENVRILFRYYRCKTFFLAECALFSLYFFQSPFRIYKKWAKKQRLDPYAYGETPLTTFDKIARAANILSRDCVYELGCGRGRTLFWLSTIIGCRGVGIDLVPTFIQKAHRIKEALRLDCLQFKEENFLSTDLTPATVLYVDATLMEESLVLQLNEKLKELKTGSRVITVGISLMDEKNFRLEKTLEGIFPWGKTDVFFHIRL